MSYKYCKEIWRSAVESASASCEKLSWTASRYICMYVYIPVRGWFVLVRCGPPFTCSQLTSEYCTTSILVCSGVSVCECVCF